MEGGTTFDWLWEYNFPPFFTIQPNEDTRKKQLDAWKSLLVGYCTFHRIYQLDVADCSTHPLFYNKDLGRGLSKESLITILNHLQSQGVIEWTDGNKTRFLIHWKSISHWAKSIYNYVTSKGMAGTVCTFYELTQSDDVQGEDFAGLDESVLRKALKTLESEGKAVIINFEGSEGVKFL